MRGIERLEKMGVTPGLCPSGSSLASRRECDSGASRSSRPCRRANRPNPEIVVYEPQPNGSLRLIGADYLVLADQWNANHSTAPELMGQLFHLFEAPNRFGLPPFYTLHVWAWKDSPTGTFVNWNKDVRCDAHNGPDK